MKLSWKKILLYAVGLFVTAFGIVLVKKAGIGVSAVSSIAASLNEVTPLSFGMTTIIFNLACFAGVVILRRKMDLWTFMIAPVTVAFGYIIDFYMFLLSFKEIPIWLSIILCAAGIFFTALGIVIVTYSGLMLPAPDNFIRTIAELIGKPHSRIKILVDLSWVVISVIMELIMLQRVVSVGAGTVASVIFTGYMIGVLNKVFAKFKKEA